MLNSVRGEVCIFYFLKRDAEPFHVDLYDPVADVKQQTTHNSWNLLY